MQKKYPSIPQCSITCEKEISPIQTLLCDIRYGNLIITDTNQQLQKEQPEVTCKKKNVKRKI